MIDLKNAITKTTTEKNNNLVVSKNKKLDIAAITQLQKNLSNIESKRESKADNKIYLFQVEKNYSTLEQKSLRIKARKTFDLLCFDVVTKNKNTDLSNKLNLHKESLNKLQEFCKATYIKNDYVLSSYRTTVKNERDKEIYIFALSLLEMFNS